MSTKRVPIEKLNWSEKLAITAGMDLSDQATVKHVSEVLQTTPTELQTNLGLAASGDFAISTSINAEDYADLFDLKLIKHTSPEKRQATPISKPTKKTSNKPAGEKKKPGRQGDKIDKAFQAITANPTPLDEFRKRFNISQPVLQQAKRFDKFSHLGRVRVITDPTTKQKVIYREQTK